MALCSGDWGSIDGSSEFLEAPSWSLDDDCDARFRVLFGTDFPTGYGGKLEQGGIYRELHCELSGIALACNNSDERAHRSPSTSVRAPLVRVMLLRVMRQTNVRRKNRLSLRASSFHVHKATEI